MTKWYLFTLNYSIIISVIVKMPLCFLPAWIFRWKLLDAFELVTVGSLQAACIAH